MTLELLHQSKGDQLSSSAKSTNARVSVWFALPGILLFVVYAWTAPRTITWWEGSSWTLAATTLGVANPPGSLILTVLGWIVSKIPLGMTKAFELNLFTGAICVVMLGFLFAAALLARRCPSNSQTDEPVTRWFEAAALSGCVLTLGLARTIWHYACVFAPYMLTGLWTAALLWAILSWWQNADRETAIRWLFVVGLLLGLDFSVHRTNLLMLPGLVACILLRRPQRPVRRRDWSAAALGMVLGLSVHFLLIPIAMRGPSINMGDPSTLSRFYEYVSLKQYGGGWLINMWPRQGPFLQHQVGDYVRAFFANFSPTSGPLGVIGVLPLVSGLLGVAIVWRAERRMALALMILFLCTSLGAVVYFNLPADFPWPMDRHYIPSFMLFGLFMILGATGFVRGILKRAMRHRWIAALAVMVIICLTPLAQFTANFRIMDASHNRFAHDYAANILTTVEPRAIVFVQGDNIWPLWYLQLVEGIRPDVSIISPSLTNASWYIKQLIDRPPGLPISLTREEVDSPGIIAWPEDSVVTVTRPETNSTRDADPVHLHVPATIMGRFAMPQDWFLVRMIIENRWQRPIYFTHVPPWLQRHSRIVGLVSQLMPTDSATVDCLLLRRNVMDSYQYTGFPGDVRSDDWMTASAGRAYSGGLRALIECQKARGDTTEALLTSERLGSYFPDTSGRRLP